jgi:PadR family transcriptional regulator PadR
VAKSAGPDLLRGTLDMLILKVLVRGPEHGYGIVRRIRTRSDDVLSVEEGSLYPALHRLEKRGDLRSHWEQSESNRRAKYYQLTPRGRARLTAETDRWCQLAGAVDAVLEVQPG